MFDSVGLEFMKLAIRRLSSRSHDGHSQTERFFRPSMQSCILKWSEAFEEPQCLHFIRISDCVNFSRCAS